MAHLSTADIQGDFATIHNIRNARYRSPTDFDLNYYDTSFDLREVQRLDFIVIPFADNPDLAHVMVSYGFSDGRYICVSVEIRRELGEDYNPLAAGLNKFELMYVVGDERDLIQLRANIWREDVYLYKIKANPQQCRAMLVSMLQCANKLSQDPEFYNTLTNNCTTNVVRHVHTLNPNLIRYGAEILLPGHSPELAFQLGLIDTDKTLAETKKLARINRQVYDIVRNDP